MNTVLAGFLGLGVLLIPLLGIRVDLEATLFGDLLLTRPVDLLQAGVGLLLQGLFFAACYRPLVFLSVDPMGAAASGLPLRALKLAMAAITAFVIVSSMAAVGVGAGNWSHVCARVVWPGWGHQPETGGPQGLLRPAWCSVSAASCWPSC